MNKNNDHPLVYVITLNWNTKDMTIECIDSILQSNYPNFRIVVVDNDSKDGSFEKFKKVFNKKIDIIKTPENLGYARGMNFGLKYADKFKPDFFLIMNNDTKIHYDAISELVKTALKYDNKCIVTGKVYHFNNPNILQYVGSDIVDKRYLTMKRICSNEEDKGQYDKESERDMIDDIFWLMPRQLYKKIGGYSPYFFMNAEQADLAMRAKENGYKLIYTPKAKIWHKGSLSTGGRTKNIKMTYWNIKSSLIFRFMHLEKRYFFIFYFKTFYKIIKNLIKNTIKKILKKDSDFMISYATFIGFLSFSLWIIKKDEATNKTPF